MRLHVFTIGKPKLAFARAGVEEYLGRLKGAGGVEIIELKGGKREQESALLLERSEGLLRVAMDERGDQVTSKDLAAKIARWELDRVKGVAFLIVGLIYAAIAAVMSLRGRERAREFSIVPEETVESVKEDVQWAQQKIS